MSTPSILIDDTDTSIDYSTLADGSPAWTQQTVGSSTTIFGQSASGFGGSIHSLTATGNFSFSFVGRAIQVLAANISSSLTSQIQETRSWNCSIDARPGPVPNPQTVSDANNWVLCDSGPLVDGPHTVTVQAATGFWFDKLAYIPSPGTDFSSDVVQIDNSDSALELDSDWIGWDEQRVHLTRVPNAAVELSFSGKQLSWYGAYFSTLPTDPSIITYTIDSSTLQTTITSPGTTARNVLFFQTPVLSPSATHNLSVFFNGTGGTTPLVLDYLIIDNGSIVNATSSADQSSDAPPNNTLRDRIIIGVVFGAIAFLFLLIFLWMRYRHILIPSKTPPQNLLSPDPSVLNINNENQDLDGAYMSVDLEGTQEAGVPTNISMTEVNSFPVRSHGPSPPATRPVSVYGAGGHLSRSASLAASARRLAAPAEVIVPRSAGTGARASVDVVS